MSWQCNTFCWKLSVWDSFLAKTRTILLHYAGARARHVELPMPRVGEQRNPQAANTFCRKTWRCRKAGPGVGTAPAATYPKRIFPWVMALATPLGYGKHRLTPANFS